MVLSWRRPTITRRVIVAIVFAMVIATSQAAMGGRIKNIIHQPTVVTSLPSDEPSVSPSQAPLGKLVDYGGSPPEKQLPLQECQGDCDDDSDCDTGLVCFQRDDYQPVPGCRDGDLESTKSDFCVVAASAPPSPAPSSIPSSNEPSPPTTTSSNEPSQAQTTSQAPTTTIFGDIAAKPQPSFSPSMSIHPTISPSKPSGDRAEPASDLSLSSTSNNSSVQTGITLENILLFPLGPCEGDCQSNQDCQIGLYCFQRGPFENVPGCNVGVDGVTDASFCVEASPTQLVNYGNHSIDSEQPLLGACQGVCSIDDHCLPGHYCFQRESFQEIPGCDGGDTDETTSAFCVVTPPGKLLNFGGSPPDSWFPLQECQGDCDDDLDCDEGLVCFQRNEYQPVPGCLDGDLEDTKTDYCVSAAPTPAPYYLPVPPKGAITYYPGNLTTYKDDLLMSEGLDSKLLAISWQNVKYANGEESTIPFHGNPDAGDTFPDFRESNLGGWVYVSNSEMKPAGTGGVGAFTFDKDGNLIDYRMVLENSTWNCGGGSTPWNTWVSCEELEEGGVAYQVDPFGERSAEVMTLGSSKGRWESFAYDIRDQSLPRFFITEDHEKGAIERFTPTNPDWNNGWEMLHGNGTIDYLLIIPYDVNATNGTFEWTSDRSLARFNAKLFYPHTEGIDVHGNELYFVCKKVKMLYILNLDEGTYTRTSTHSGLFNSQPDQLQQILGESSGLLYFTEDGGSYAGIHARDKDGRFYTIMESTVLPGETTGLAFSPNGMFMYVAYQKIGHLYTLWRRDGLPFQSKRLDVKYHEATAG